MSAVKLAWRRLLSVFNGRNLDRDFEDEAQSHIEFAAEDYVQRGVPVAEAHRLARLKFGSIAASKDAHRDSRGLPSLERFFFDLRLAVRDLQRDRSFTLAAIAMLTLAIGLNVTVFTVMDAMLFRGFPHVLGNDRLLYLQERSSSGRCCLSFPDFEDWRAQAKAFEDMAFVAGNRPILFRDGDGRPIDLLTFRISANTFGLLGVSPMLGRDFVAADEMPGAPQVAILNYRFWETRFATRADIVGTIVQIDGAPARIIGVMPEGFDFPTHENLWMPVSRTPELLRRGLTPGGFMAVGRLRDGVDRHAARTELETINRRLEAAYPATNRGLVPTVATHSQTVSGRDAPLIWGSLWAGSWFVLLIACANAANLLLLRMLGRWREFSTRMALGAGQGRMMRQIAIESVAVAGLAGALGWWLANWCIDRWTITTASRYQILDYTRDAGTLAYLVAISVTAAIFVSLAPIGRLMRPGVSGALTAAARGVTQDQRGKRLAAGLVAGQMALAIVLLSGSGVLIRSFVKIVGAETGVRDPEHVLVGLLRLPSSKYPPDETRRQYFDRLQARLRAIPGVEAQSIATALPVGSGLARTFHVEGKPSPPAEEETVQFLRVGTDYFHVLGAPLISGRNFNDGDRPSALPVAIVNESFAARFWPGEEVVGKRVRSTDPNSGAWRVVIGVAPNIMQGDSLRQTFKPLVYVPFTQEPTFRAAYFLVRTSVPPGQVSQSVQSTVQELDPDVPLESFMTLKASFAFDRDFMDAEHSELGKHAAVAPVFGAIALLLAAIGLSAVVSHSVTQRVKEIGVRMAIGAAAKDVRQMILREGMLPVAAGLLLGLAGSIAVNRILQSQLVGVSPYDPATMAGAPLILIAVALAACVAPVRRAVTVDPVIALRHE